MTDRFTAIVARPVRPGTPLDVQASWLRHEALGAMQTLGIPNVESLRLGAASADATVTVGGTPTGPESYPTDGILVSLWQHNMFAAIFYADGRKHGAEDQYVGEVDLAKGVFETARVERGLSA